jgi:hypothetical protein
MEFMYEFDLRSTSAYHNNQIEISLYPKETWSQLKNKLKNLMCFTIENPAKLWSVISEEASIFS